jgi:hypothetical protein
VAGDALVLGFPVDEARLVEKVLERRQAHSCVLGERGRRIPAQNPRHVVAVEASPRGPVCAPDSSRTARADVGTEPGAGRSGTIVGVLRGSDLEDRIALLQCVHVDRGRLGNHFERRMREPRTVVEQAAAERQTQERIRAPYAELPHDLL